MKRNERYKAKPAEYNEKMGETRENDATSKEGSRNKLTNKKEGGKRKRDSKPLSDQ